MTNKPQRFCSKCDSEMIYVDHVEYDGDLGSHEPYWECPDGCEDLDYDTPPNEAIFKDIKHNCVVIWKTYDDTYGYATEKIDYIKPLQNIKDNCLTMVSMFDVQNMRKLLLVCNMESRAWLEPFLEEHFEAERKLAEMGFNL